MPRDARHLGAAAAIAFTFLALVAASCAPPPRPPVAPVQPLPPPPPGTVRLFVGGDSRDDTSHVVPWAFEEAHARHAHAFFFLGDMELTPGLDRHFLKELEQLDPIPFFPVPGNHDVKPFGFMDTSKESLQKSFRERFLGTPRTPVQSVFPDKVVFSVDLAGGVHFVGLDNVSQKGFGADQIAWFARDLAAARARPGTRHVIVGMHKALAHNGVTTHAMDDDGQEGIDDSARALDLMVKAKVSLIVASHEHLFAKFTQRDIPSYITGGLGAPLKKASGEQHAFHHLLQLDVTDAHIHVEIVHFNGKPSETDEIDDD